MRNKIFIIKILTLFLSAPLSAQYSEVGVFGGGSHFIGDVGNYGLHIPQGYAFGGFYRYVLNDRWSFRVQVNYGKIANADSLSTFDYRKNRNLHFSSTILEANVMAEFNFLKFKPGSRYNHTPYMMGGFGIFQFNPKAVYQGEEYELQPLATEAQGINGNSAPYALASSYFIFGAGYKFAVNKFTTIGIESTVRKTRTDYLDDVSGFYGDPDDIQAAYGDVAAALSDRSLIESDKENLLRGNPNTTDWYIFTGVTLQFKFGELYEKCAYFLGK